MVIKDVNHAFFVVVVVCFGSFKVSADLFFPNRHLILRFIYGHKSHIT